MSDLFATLACNLDADLLSASFPLLEESRVEALEWSFDALYKHETIPVWFDELLRAYSSERRLVGHGIFFSLFSGRWSESQKTWLEQLKNVCRTYSFDHITEHFGFMTGADFHHGAPMSVPYSPVSLSIGQDRLKRIYEACSCPVGLENLAFAYSVEEVARHGEFLTRLIEPVNGFIILDVHNLYCQSHNFSVDYHTLLAQYPLERVREIHISGGSWQPSKINPAITIRRDTHDDRVPDEVFRLLEHTIRKCPNLRYVVLEQLSAGLQTPESQKGFYQDFVRMQEIVHRIDAARTAPSHYSFLPSGYSRSENVVESETLHRQQAELSNILETALNYQEAITRLHASSLADSDWQIERWQPDMLDTAIQIAQKWKKKQARKSPS